MAPGSLVPKMPLSLGWACISVLAISADFSWSPPYCTSTTLILGYLALIWFRNPSRRPTPVVLVWSWAITATSPSPPIFSAILSAARAAAATLLVVAVVTGMSLSTPESNAITGMLAALALRSSGMAALLSSAAKPMAEGFLAMAAESMSICLSTCCSVSGPSNVTFTL
ncbi:hypothetical protein D9M69_631280 [compost metagenome]